MKIGLFCSTFPCSTQLSTGVEDRVYVAGWDNGQLRRAAISAHASPVTTVENRGRGTVVYTRGSLPLEVDETT